MKKIMIMLITLLFSCNSVKENNKLTANAALKIALKALGVKRGDEVITQAFNFIATIEAILDIGAKPIIANVDKSLNIDVSEVKKLISKKTKVIIPVHMLGVAADLKGLRKVLKKSVLRTLKLNTV